MLFTIRLVVFWLVTSVAFGQLATQTEDPALDILDGKLNAPFCVSSLLEIHDVSTIIDIDLALIDINHQTIPDLRIELISPSDTIALLLEPLNTDGLLVEVSERRSDFDHTTLDDDASTNLAGVVVPSQGAWFNGSFNVNHQDPNGVLPVGATVSSPLSVFDGESGTGTWTLRICDESEGGVGQLHSWGLNITSVPEPTFPAHWIGLWAATLMVRGAGCRSGAETRR